MQSRLSIIAWASDPNNLCKVPTVPSPQSRSIALDAWLSWSSIPVQLRCLLGAAAPVPRNVTRIVDFSDSSLLYVRRPSFARSCYAALLFEIFLRFADFITRSLRHKHSDSEESNRLAKY